MFLHSQISEFLYFVAKINSIYNYILNSVDNFKNLIL